MHVTIAALASCYSTLLDLPAVNINAAYLRPRVPRVVVNKPRLYRAWYAERIVSTLSELILTRSLVIGPTTDERG